MADLTLTFDDVPDVMHSTPAALEVLVGNGEDGEAITFNLYDSGTGEWLAIFTDDLSESGQAQCGVEIPEVPAGAYTLEVTGVTSTSATLDFSIANEPLNEDEDDLDMADPEAPEIDDPEPGVRHWKLVDTTTGDPREYTFPHNPSRWTNPNPPNHLTHDVTSAPDGAVLAWQGGDRSWTFEFSGYLDTQEHYEALEFWTSQRRRFWLIDHRGQVRYVTFEMFDARARIVPGKPWAHDYTIRALHFYWGNYPWEVV